MEKNLKNIYTEVADGLRNGSQCVHTRTAHEYKRAVTVPCFEAHASVVQGAADSPVLEPTATTTRSGPVQHGSRARHAQEQQRQQAGNALYSTTSVASSYAARNPRAAVAREDRV